MPPSQRIRFFITAASCLWVMPVVLAQPPVPGARAVPEHDGVFRSEARVYIQVVDAAQLPVRIPRLATPLRSIAWLVPEQGPRLNLQPLIAEWLIAAHDPAQAAESSGGWIVLECDAAPRLMAELSPIAPAADGSFFLPAHLARTEGQSLRYEPQPHKNTVGYWTQATDVALWRLTLDRPGSFNLAILQGCGKGQGGSQAELRIEHAAPGQQSATVEFTVLETGHFQNFQWLALGVARLNQPGELELTVRPVNIRRAALMDIRAVHLVRLPDEAAN